MKSWQESSLDNKNHVFIVLSFCLFVFFRLSIIHIHCVCNNKRIFSMEKKAPFSFKNRPLHFLVLATYNIQNKMSGPTESQKCGKYSLK